MMVTQNLLSRLFISKDLGSNKWSLLVVRACGGDLRVPNLLFSDYFVGRRIMFLPLYRNTHVFSSMIGNIKVM